MGKRDIVQGENNTLVTSETTIETLGFLKSKSAKGKLSETPKYQVVSSGTNIRSVYHSPKLTQDLK